MPRTDVPKRVDPSRQRQLRTLKWMQRTGRPIVMRHRKWYGVADSNRWLDASTMLCKGNDVKALAEKGLIVVFRGRRALLTDAGRAWPEHGEGDETGTSDPRA